MLTVVLLLLAVVTSEPPQTRYQTLSDRISAVEARMLNDVGRLVAGTGDQAVDGADVWFVGAANIGDDGSLEKPHDLWGRSFSRERVTPTGKQATASKKADELDPNESNDHGYNMDDSEKQTETLHRHRDSSESKTKTLAQPGASSTVGYASEIMAFEWVASDGAQSKRHAFLEDEKDPCGGKKKADISHSQEVQETVDLQDVNAEERRLVQAVRRRIQGVSNSTQVVAVAGDQLVELFRHRRRLRREIPAPGGRGAAELISTPAETQRRRMQEDEMTIRQFFKNMSFDQLMRWYAPGGLPTEEPTERPTEEPSEEPTEHPSKEPTKEPSEQPSNEPTQQPSTMPSPEPTEAPSEEPYEEPTWQPSAATEEPTTEPTQPPTAQPSDEPTEEPTAEPTAEPTEEPSEGPTDEPTEEPSEVPTEEPTEKPTGEPIEEPTEIPTEAPTGAPTKEPTLYGPQEKTQKVPRSEWDAPQELCVDDHACLSKKWKSYGGNWTCDGSAGGKDGSQYCDDEKWANDIQSCCPATCDTCATRVQVSLEADPLTNTNGKTSGLVKYDSPHDSGYVCKDNCDRDQARVVCRQLKLYLESYDTGPVFKDDKFTADSFSCVGNEKKLDLCKPNKNKCSSNIRNTVRVSCSLQEIPLHQEVYHAILGVVGGSSFIAVVVWLWNTSCTVRKEHKAEKRHALEAEAREKQAEELKKADEHRKIERAYMKEVQRQWNLLRVTCGSSPRPVLRQSSTTRSNDLESPRDEDAVRLN